MTVEARAYCEDAFVNGIFILMKSPDEETKTLETSERLFFLAHQQYFCLAVCDCRGSTIRFVSFVVRQVL